MQLIRSTHPFLLFGVTAPKCMALNSFQTLRVVLGQGWLSLYHSCEGRLSPCLSLAEA